MKAKFNGKTLLRKYKKTALENAENLVFGIYKDTHEWVLESLDESNKMLMPIVEPILNEVKELAVRAIDKIDGEENR